MPNDNDELHNETITNQFVFIGMKLVGHSHDSSSMGMGYEERESMPATAFSIILADRTAEHYQEALVESEKKEKRKTYSLFIATIYYPKIE